MSKQIEQIELATGIGQLSRRRMPVSRQEGIKRAVGDATTARDGLAGGIIRGVLALALQAEGTAAERVATVREAVREATGTPVEPSVGSKAATALTAILVWLEAHPRVATLPDAVTDRALTMAQVGGVRGLSHVPDATLSAWLDGEAGQTTRTGAHGLLQAWKPEQVSASGSDSSQADGSDSEPPATVTGTVAGDGPATTLARSLVTALTSDETDETDRDRAVEIIGTHLADVLA